jgi:hypothetical protein
MRYPSWDDEALREAYDKYLAHCEAYTEEVASAKGILTLRRPKVPSFTRFKMFAGVNLIPTSQAYPTLMDIKADIESRMEEALMNGQGNTTGLIFTLKVNYGWQDKQVVEGNNHMTVEFKDGSTIL